MIRAIFLALLFSLTGCSTFDSLGDYVSSNPLVASIATRQAVASYIAQGESLEEEYQRAEQVQRRIQKVLIYLDSDAEATAYDLMRVINDSINWDELTLQDRLLVQDIVSLVENELSAVQVGAISGETKLALAGLFETAISAARLYMVGQ